MSPRFILCDRCIGRYPRQASLDMDKGQGHRTLRWPLFLQIPLGTRTARSPSGPIAQFYLKNSMLREGFFIFRA